jgi:hypothetical protein
VRKLERFTDRITAIEGQKQRTIDLYAAGALPKDAYTAENLTLDRELQRLQRRKIEIAREVQAAAGNDMVDHCIRDHCERARARLDRCSTFDLTRQFLLDHVQRIVYLREKVTILGSVPVKRSPSEAAVSMPFRIEGELDRKAIRTKPHKVLPDDGRWKKLKETVSEDVPPGVKEVALSPVGTSK